MPEGPSIIIMKEAVQHFKGKVILDAWGTGKADNQALIGKKIIDIRTLGKQLLVMVKGVTVRVHLLMFGTYSVDELDRPKNRVRLALVFRKGAAYFYTCSVTSVEGDAGEMFDWKSDIMGDKWDAASARKKLKEKGGMLVSDALLDQDIFAGVGNIIKNEVLYRVRLHPETLVKDIAPAKITQMMKEARKYSFDFLHQKKAGTLQDHWEA